MDVVAPKLSVVIPVRDGAATIAAQLEALASSRDPGIRFEVVVADNGSSDGTAALVASYAERLPVRVVDAGAVPGVNAARNAGVRASQGDWLLFCDADDEVDEHWLAAMAGAFRAGHRLVGGPIDYVRLNATDVVAWRGAPQASVDIVCGFLPAAHSANLGVVRSVYDRVGGFDESFTYGGDDIEFTWKVQLAGIELHEEPNALVHYRLRPTLGALWRQWTRYGACEPLLYAKFASAGMPRRALSDLARDVWWLATRLPFAWSRARRGAWLRRCATQWGRFVGARRARTLWW